MFTLNSHAQTESRPLYWRILRILQILQMCSVVLSVASTGHAHPERPGCGTGLAPDRRLGSPLAVPGAFYL